MLLPKKVKHRKWQRGDSRTKISHRGTEVSFGKFGMKVLARGWLSSRQIEAVRRTMTRFLKREGKIWIRIFPDRPITAKGTEVPMGAGKGDVVYYVASVKPGRIIFELDGIDEKTAREAVRLGGHKLPIPVKFIKN